MGCLIGLGALAKNSELVVIRAAGVSTVRIIFSAMKPAMVVVCVGLVFGEFIAPYTEKIAQSQKALAQGAATYVTTRGGLWHREANTFMHFNAVEPNGVLHGVSLQRYDDNRRLLRSTFARRAIYQREQWLLEDLDETRFFDDRLEVHHFVLQLWETDLSPSLLNVLMVKPDNLSISGLYSYSQYLREQDLNADQYLMSF
jgi:lipopolysaccharide export system permease protein